MSAGDTPAESSGHHEVVQASPDALLFDTRNPRLTIADSVASQHDILKLLWEEMSVDEIAISIASNGYYAEEPLLVISHDEHDGDIHKYVVVEGNRRLAAVRLLLDGVLRDEVGATNLPEAPPWVRTQIEDLTAHLYADRRDIWTYIGFRHINGAKPWASFSKAAYVARIRHDYQLSLEEIARRIGDTHATVARLYRGYSILEQAENESLFFRDDRYPRGGPFPFSHLYTAASQSEYQWFLSIGPQDLGPAPVPEARLAHLREMLIWLYGSKSEDVEPAVRSQNPDLNRLRVIIGRSREGDNRALSLLRSGLSLHRTFEATLDEGMRLREYVARAKDELQHALGFAPTGYDGDRSIYTDAQDIVNLSKRLLDVLEERRN